MTVKRKAAGNSPGGCWLAGPKGSPRVAQQPGSRARHSGTAGTTGYVSVWPSCRFMLPCCQRNSSSCHDGARPEAEAVGGAHVQWALPVYFRFTWRLDSSEESRLSCSAHPLGCQVVREGKRGVCKEDVWQVLRLWTQENDCLLKSLPTNTKHQTSNPMVSWGWSVQQKGTE